MKKCLFSFVLVLWASCAFAVTLEFSTFLGAGDYDFVKGLDVNNNGESFISGHTSSNTFPITSGVLDPSFNGGNYDVIVSKISSDGTTLGFSTFLGGTNVDYCYDLAIDGIGNSYIIGTTYSNNFPTQSAFDYSYNGSNDVFVAKISDNGSSIIYASYLGAGGGGSDWGFGLAIDTNTNLYTTGMTTSSNFPIVSGSFSNSKNGNWDIFISKFDFSGTSLLYSTYLGGNENTYEVGYAIVTDSLGNAILTGSAGQSFPTTNGSFDVSFNDGQQDAFITKISYNGSTLLYSSYLGGSVSENGYNIISDDLGNMVIAGWSDSNNFPIQSGFVKLPNTCSDAFISKISNDGTSLIYSTFLGGGSCDDAYGLSMDETGSVYVSGETYSNNFPILNAIDASYNGYSDFFLAQISSSGAKLNFATYIGGSLEDRGVSCKYKNGSLFLNGNVESNDFPITNGSFSQIQNGSFDGAIVRLMTTISELKILGSGSDVILNWQEKQDATLYRIYRNTDPEFTSSTQIGTLTPNGSFPTFTDIGAAQSSEKYFYFVTWEN